MNTFGESARPPAPSAGPGRADRESQARVRVVAASTAKALETTARHRPATTTPIAGPSTAPIAARAAAQSPATAPGAVAVVPSARTAPRHGGDPAGGTETRRPPARPGSTLVSLDEARRLHELRNQIRRLVQAIMEGLNGVRPLQQLSRWLEPAVFASLQLRRTLVQEAREHFGQDRPSPYADAQVQSVHAQGVTALIVEAAVVVRCRKRTRAVAIRLEARRASWIVTALEIG